MTIWEIELNSPGVYSSAMEDICEIEKLQKNLNSKIDLKKEVCKLTNWETVLDLPEVYSSATVEIYTIICPNYWILHCDILQDNSRDIPILA